MYISLAVNGTETSDGTKRDPRQSWGQKLSKETSKWTPAIRRQEPDLNDIFAGRAINQNSIPIPADPNGG